MSIKIAAEEIVRFLATADPEVLCITGPWGAGKTFAWNRFLRGADKVALDDYAYVSLFGQNSIQDVRNSIFENTEQLKPAKANSEVANWKEKGERLGRRLISFRKSVAAFLPEGAVAIGERLMFASLKPQIVCIDDLERAGEGLSKRDVLGLVSQLKEQKKCKVVLLLNSAALGDDEAEFNRQIEKVVDTVISFEPTPAEAAAIGILDTAPQAELLRSHCVKLAIRNIRVIKRIEAACRRLHQLLDGFDERVMKQAFHTAALFTFSRYQPDSAPSAAFIRAYNIVPLGAQEGDEHPEWRQLLSDYDFAHVDELDVIVAQGVLAGHFDRDLLRKHAEQQQKSLRLQDQDGSFHEAWNRYHHSFDDDEEEVLDQMAEAFRKNVEAVTPLNAAGTARLFKELGRERQSRELIQYYVATRQEPQDFWDLDDSPFRGDITDPDVIQLFRQKYESFEPPLEDPATILLRINKQSGWSQRDVNRLAQITEDEFYAMFKAPHGKDLTRITAEAMRFRTRGPEGSPERGIFERANAALERIAAESLINARRVRQHRSRG